MSWLLRLWRRMFVRRRQPPTTSTSAPASVSGHRLAQIVKAPSPAELHAAREAAEQFDGPVGEQPRGITADYFFRTEPELIGAVHAARDRVGETLSNVRDLDEALRVSGAIAEVAQGCDAEINVQWPAGADVLASERFLFSLFYNGDEWLIPRDLRFAFPGYADFPTAAACGHGHRIALARALAQFVQGCHDHELALGQVTPSGFLFAAGYPPPLMVCPAAGLRRLGHRSPLATGPGPASDPVDDRRAVGPMVIGLLADAHPDHWTLDMTDRLSRLPVVRRRGPSLLAHLTARLLAGGQGVPQAGEWLDVIDEHEQE